MITDFGRTSNLAGERQTAQRNRQIKTSANTRAQVLVEVQQAYYQALAAQSVLKVVQATLDLRRSTLRQVTALAQSALRSTVDVSFAQVNVSQAELDLFRAQNDARAAAMRDCRRPWATIATSRFRWATKPLPAALNPDVDALIAEAQRERPDLAALRLNRDALDAICGCRKAAAQSHRSVPSR